MDSIQRSGDLIKLSIFHCVLDDRFGWFIDSRQLRHQISFRREAPNETADTAF
jgi:hypothetical protein